MKGTVFTMDKPYNIFGCVFHQTKLAYEKIDFITNDGYALYIR